MQCALIPAKLKHKCLQQNPGSNQVHGKCFTDFSEVKIVSFCRNFQQMHPICRFATLHGSLFIVYVQEITSSSSGMLTI